MYTLLSVLGFIFTALLYVLFYIAIFLLIRKLVLWYWKVDRVASQLEKLYHLQLILNWE
jgi:hypothetical protein